MAEQAEESTTESQQDKKPEVPSFLANPTKIDIALIIAIMVMGIFSLAMIPLRAWLLSNPLAYTLLVGGYTSSILGGAHASEGHGSIALYFFCMLFGALKFQVIYWYLGKRWGQEFIDMSLASMPRAKRWADRVLNNPSTKSRLGTMLFVPLGYLPGPVPGNIVNALLGLLRVGFMPMLLLNLVSVGLVNGVFMYLGYVNGDAVLSVVEVINRYVLWITLALLAVMFWRMRKQQKAMS